MNLNLCIMFYIVIEPLGYRTVVGEDSMTISNERHQMLHDVRIYYVIYFNTNT